MKKHLKLFLLLLILPCFAAGLLLGGVGKFGALKTYAAGEKPSGSWADFTSTEWTNVNNARYNGYTETPGSSLAFPYLINTAEEFSGIRTFEDGNLLAGKYMVLTEDIDLSAHYWDPIELYGSGNHVDDIENRDYSGAFDLPPETDVVHFNGNGCMIFGMTILNNYDSVKIPVRNIMGIEENLPATAGSTGLFSYAYKAHVANVFLKNPKLTLTEESRIMSELASNIGSTDAISAVIGVSHYSRISDVHVIDIEINYNANIECDAIFNDIVNSLMYRTQNIIIGGCVGYSFGQSLIRDTSVRGGYINVEPQKTVLYNPDAVRIPYDNVIIGGAVGLNYKSVVFNSGSEVNISFSTKSWEISSDDIRLYSSVFIGGLIGESTSEPAIEACAYNSYSHSNLNVDMQKQPEYCGIGGIVGLLKNDSLVNTYFNGEILCESVDDFLNYYTGEIVGNILYYDSNSFPILLNYYYPERWNSYGTGYASPETMFAEITTAEALLADLNAGRAEVLNQIVGHSVWSSEDMAPFVTGWIVDGAGEIVIDFKYTRKVNISWMNGQSKHASTQILYYSQPETPDETSVTPANNAQYSYTFKGWSLDPAAVLDGAVISDWTNFNITENTTFYAVFTCELNKYKVVFVDANGTEIHSETIAYGTVPSFAGTITPTKPDSTKYRYTFAGWSSTADAAAAEYSPTDTLPFITGNETYYAVFKAEKLSTNSNSLWIWLPIVVGLILMAAALLIIITVIKKKRTEE